RCSSGLTLRQRLTPSGQASLWWYHPVSFKDCEGEPTFQSIIAVMTIRAVAEQCGVSKLILVGAPREVAAVLRSGFSVKEIGTHQSHGLWWLVLRGLVGRVLYAAQTLRICAGCRRWTSRPRCLSQIAFSGFWDWSVSWNDQTGSLSDRYFKSLPDELRRAGILSIGWLVWLDHHSDPSKQRRRLKDVLAPLKNSKGVTILQGFLYLRDILRAVGDFGPLATFLSVRKESSFRELFQANGIDYASLFTQPLLCGFLNWSLPYNELVALATERAASQVRPQAFLSFLEHFPYARAQYEGLRRAGLGTINIAVQHASYCREKTFYALHESLEFHGEPDGCAVPHPDYISTMGSLGLGLFLECGYPKDRVLLTGSPRYDHVRSGKTDAPSEKEINFSSPKRTHDGEGGQKPTKDGTRLLMVCGLDVDLEMDMVEAVCTAAGSLEGLKIFLRSHPFRQIEKHPRFRPYASQIELLHGLLLDAILDADLILFTYSTVADEAYVMGKPVWQWLPLGFNGSALAEIAKIPQFASVASLRQALQQFCFNPSDIAPEASARQDAVEQLFYRTDGQSARRIARAVSQFLGVQS
ncbi:MAG: hypothetical protein V3T23_04110, partial [Nitrososphaerales archaeon]